MPPKDSNKKKFATFADLNASSSGHGSGGSRDHSGSGSASPFGGRDERDPNDLYTGGEKSGLAVINPNNDNNGSSSGSSGSDPSSIGAHLVNEIMRHARENRQRLPADDGDDDEEYDQDDEDSAQTRRRRAFQGRGHQLKEAAPSADDMDDDEEDNNSDDVFARQMEEYERARHTRVTRHLTFWRNGFTVEDSQLYRYDDPENIPHLRALDQGMAPLALLNVLPGQAVDLNVIQKKDEDYVAPKPKPGGYHGAGRRLGSPVPGEAHIVSGSASPQPASAAGSSAAATPAPPVSNEGEGDATVQIRLADGSRHKHRFQSSGPIQQLYTFVDQLLSQSDGNSAARTWTLQTTFPNKELSDRSQDLKAAGVIGAVVVQKWT